MGVLIMGELIQMMVGTGRQVSIANGQTMQQPASNSSTQQAKTGLSFFP